MKLFKKTLSFEFTSSETSCFNGGENLTKMLERINTADGNVVPPKAKISKEVGFMAIFMDTEESKIALHSQKYFNREFVIQRID